jgi:hypothetical protein
MPRMADYEAAIVFSCLVHCGCPIDPFLLQHMLAREPRQSFSPGIMADLQSALQVMEQQQLQQLGAGQGVELQLLLGDMGLEQQQQQQVAGGGQDADGGSSSSWYDPWYDGAQQQQQQDQDWEVYAADDVVQDVDSLIDQARSEIGAAQNLWQQQRNGSQETAQQQEESGTAKEQHDAEMADRIKRRIAVVEELFAE